MSSKVITGSGVILIALISASLFRLLMIISPTDDYSSRIDQELGPKLSPNASIAYDTSVAPRWSDYHAPQPGTIVNVAEENDVVETVKYCINHNINFLVQSGTHGWTAAFNISQKYLIINMRGMNKVHVNDAKDKITFEGGALVSEVLETAHQNHVQSTIPVCNCVGMSGATLGGGFNRLSGQFGLVIDNLLSINIVTADGELRTVTPTSFPDLWWALRGAGANFGVVTSMTMKAYPPINSGIGWLGDLTFAEDKLENVLEALNHFSYAKEMCIVVFFAPFPLNFPAITLNLYYSGSETEGKTAYKVFYDIGPIAETSQELPYNRINDGFNFFCGKGGRKPTYSAALKKLDLKRFRKIWNEYVSFMSKNPLLNATAILLEPFSPHTVRNFSNSDSAFSLRNANFEIFLTTVYGDAELDQTFESFGKEIRKALQESSGFEDPRVYVNFGHGDESLEVIYGENLPRLKEIKQKWDKDGRFSQLFGIPAEASERKTIKDRY